MRPCRRSIRFWTIPLRALSLSGARVNISANPLTIDLTHGVTLSGTFTGKARNAQLPLEILGAPGIVHTVFGAQGFTVSANVRAAATAPRSSRHRS